MVSIIIPVYNVQDYLRPCLDSVIAQTHADWEAILVNDGSTDSSPAICAEYAALDPRIRVVHRENGGLSAARNTGIESARGEYLAFLDSDDYLPDDAIETLVRMQRETGADLCAAHMMILREPGGLEALPISVKGVEVFAGADKMAAYIRDHKIRNSAGSKLYARALFDEIRFPVGRISEDLAVMYRLIHAARCVALTDRVGYIYRKREGSLMTRRISARDFDDLQIRMEQRRFIQQHYPALVEYLPAQLFSAALMFTVRTAVDRFSDKEIDRRLQEILRRNLKSYLRRSRNRNRNLIACLAAVNIHWARGFIRSLRRVRPGAINISW